MITNYFRLLVLVKNLCFKINVEKADNVGVSFDWLRVLAALLSPLMRAPLAADHFSNNWSCLYYENSLFSRYFWIFFSIRNEIFLGLFLITSGVKHRRRKIFNQRKYQSKCETVSYRTCKSCSVQLAKYSKF